MAHNRFWTESIILLRLGMIRHSRYLRRAKCGSVLAPTDHDTAIRLGADHGKTTQPAGIYPTKPSWKSVPLLWRKDIPTCPSSFPDIWRLKSIRSLPPMRPSTKPRYGLQECPVYLTSWSGLIERTRQKWKSFACRLSVCLRPSRVELLYAVPLSNIEPSSRNQWAPQHPAAGMAEDWRSGNERLSDWWGKDSRTKTSLTNCRSVTVRSAITWRAFSRRSACQSLETPGSCTSCPLHSCLNTN